MSIEDARTEYKILRDTIRERGTRRITLFWMSLGVWAALLVATTLHGLAPYGSLVPLVALAAGFEAVYALHIGIERIGRYVQVFYEETGALPSWEHTAMAYGREPAKDGVDPLFSRIFAVALLLNFATVIPTRQFGLILVALVAHGLFAARIFRARQYAGRQRVQDLERFRKLKNDTAIP